MDVYQKRRVSWKQLLDLSAPVRANRVFLAFGGALPSEAKTAMTTKIRQLCSTQHTASQVWKTDFMSETFWRQTSCFHAVAVFYDSEGNGILSDPCLHGYKIVDVLTLHFSLAWVHSLYEVNIGNV
jgi:hypothetical protein